MKPGAPGGETKMRLRGAAGATVVLALLAGAGLIAVRDYVLPLRAIPHLIGPLPAAAPSPELQQALDRAVARFRLDKPPAMRLSASAWVRLADGQFECAHIEGTALHYPGCSAKLPWLAAMHALARERKFDIAGVESLLRPTFVASENPPFGELVDAMTRNRNLEWLASPGNPVYRRWKSRRLVAEEYVRQLGLLSSQRFGMKTYPSNSGGRPAGAEAVLFREHGGNRMETSAGLALLAGILEGVIEPQATQPMTSLLRRDARSWQSGLGYGLPPGTVHYGKSGLGHESLSDFMKFDLPNGRSGYFAAISDLRGYGPPGVRRGNELAEMGDLTELFLDEAGLLEGMVRPVVREFGDSDDARTADFETTTVIVQGKVVAALHCPAFSPESSAALALEVPAPGLYRIELRVGPNPCRVYALDYRLSGAPGDPLGQVVLATGSRRWQHLATVHVTRRVTVELSHPPASMPGRSGQPLTLIAVRAYPIPHGVPLDSDAEGVER